MTVATVTLTATSNDGRHRQQSPRVAINGSKDEGDCNNGNGDGDGNGDSDGDDDGNDSGNDDGGNDDDGRDDDGNNDGQHNNDGGGGDKTGMVRGTTTVN